MISSIESLEPRTHFAATAVVVDGVLVVRGTNNRDTIVVAIDPDNPSQFLITNNDNNVGDAPMLVAGVTRIDVSGRGDRDSIRITDDAGLTLPTTLRGGAAKDTVVGGNGNDLIMGGSGGDDCSGTVGNDTIFGGGGNDALDGGEGADSLLGQQGNDLLTGQDDNDTLIGGNGPDTLIGGTGDDSVLGGLGEDVIDGGDGDDALRGGNDSDTVRGGTGADYFAGHYVRTEIKDLSDEDSREFRKFDDPNDDNGYSFGDFWDDVRDFFT